MALDKVATGSNVIDLLDHVLDKGVVIDSWLRVSIGGIDLVSAEARMLVASLQTYVRHAAQPATGASAVPVYELKSLPGQLRRIRKALDRSAVPAGYERRRAEDRIVDELRDSRLRALPASPAAH